MKLEFMDDDCYKVFINSNYITDFDIESNDDIGKYVKKIILKIRKLYGVTLEGFYEVHVYYIKYIGMILEIKNIDSYYSKTIDLKIVVHNDEKSYLKIDQYELIKKYKEVNYFNNYFYLPTSELQKNDILSLAENIEILYGSSIEELKNKWYHLTF